MNIQLFSILIPLITTYIMIRLMRPIALRINLTDQPNDRKIHSGAIPLIGGVAMFFGVQVTILLLPHDLNEFKYFLLSSLIIVGIGVLDDNSDIPVWTRFIFQFIVAIIVISLGGVSVMSLGNLFGNGDILLNEWSYFFSVIAIIVAMNAVNMADGLHGLAGGNSLISFLSISFLSINSLLESSLLISLLFCIVLPVFLMHNLCIGVSSSKRIFMGDAGSMFIGLSLVWVLFEFSQGEARTFPPVIALWLIAFPLIEIASTVLRRLNSGVSPFKPDSFHTHHVLIKLGFSEKKTLIVILTFSILMAIIGILGDRYLIDEYLMLLSFVLIFIIHYISISLAIRKIKHINE